MSEMNIVPLDKLLPGEGGFINAYSEPKDLHHRLKELGLVKGTRVRVRRCAPLGDPMELSIRGYHLSIRREDAKHILIVKDGEELRGCRNERGHCGRRGWCGTRHMLKVQK